MKICPKCQKENLEDHICCTVCGTRLIDLGTPNDTNNQSIQVNQKTGLDALGILVGIALIIVGIINVFIIKDLKFGADFYTEIYKVVAICARVLLGLCIAAGIAMIIACGNHARKR